MPLPTITTSDFAGFIAISQDRFNDAILADYISVFTIDYVRYFLGDGQYVDIINDTVGLQKYNDLFNGVTYTDSSDVVRVVSGLTGVLKAMIYYEYVRKQRYVNTVNGVEVNRNENSLENKSANGYVQAWSRYTRAVSQYNDEIVCFLNNYRQISESISSSVDLGGGSYTINVASTLYLYDSDTVSIDGVDYTVSNLVADTSFDISGAVAGLDFTGKDAIWQPFDGAVYGHKMQSFF